MLEKHCANLPGYTERRLSVSFEFSPAGSESKGFGTGGNGLVGRGSSVGCECSSSIGRGCSIGRGTSLGHDSSIEEFVLKLELEHSPDEICLCFMGCRDSTSKGKCSKISFELDNSILESESRAYLVSLRVVMSSSESPSNKPIYQSGNFSVSGI